MVSEGDRSGRSDMATLTLTEFLLARIAEDEAIAEAAATHAPGGEWIAYDPDADTELAGRFGAVITGGMRPTAWPEHAAHIARFDPARVLAECEAKRRIVELHRGELGECQTCLYDVYPDEPALGDQISMESYPCPTLRAQALPYADHPDFNPDWRI